DVVLSNLLRDLSEILRQPGSPCLDAIRTRGGVQNLGEIPHGRVELGVVFDAFVEENRDRRESTVLTDELAFDEGRVREGCDQPLTLFGLDRFALDGGSVSHGAETLGQGLQAQREALRCGSYE